jgi:hypothetical protein
MAYVTNLRRCTLIRTADGVLGRLFYSELRDYSLLVKLDSLYELDFDSRNKTNFGATFQRKILHKIGEAPLIFLYTSILWFILVLV